jgi:uncharacterized membrane protein YidH (DUF202 family)
MTADGAAARRRQQSGAALADERTDLAWNRCGLTLVVCGLVIMRGLTLKNFPRTNVTVGAVILGLGVVSYVVAAWHARRRLAPDRALRAASGSDLWPVAMAVTAIGLAAFVLGLLFPA